MTLMRAVGVAILSLLVLLAAHRAVLAAEAGFSLATGQSVTVGQYKLVFTGVRSGRPAYALYLGSALVAQFPGPTPSLNPAEYSYGNGSIAIVTTSVAPDGTQATGRFIVR